MHWDGFVATFAEKSWVSANSHLNVDAGHRHVFGVEQTVGVELDWS